MCVNTCQSTSAPHHPLQIRCSVLRLLSGSAPTGVHVIRNHAGMLQSSGMVQGTYMAVARRLYEVQLWPSVIICC